MALMWNQGSRNNSLIRKMAKLDTIVIHTMPEFSEILFGFINELPRSPVKATARRFYVEGDTQKKSPTTGRPTKEDGRFYQYLDTFAHMFADYYRREYGNTAQ